jgi:sulfur transfer complex TusBCD TusB component (DsrH family)
MEGRRSTRVEHPVTLIVLGKNGLGQPFQEKTASVSVNLHGCRYPSRHEYPVGSWVGLQVVHSDRQARSPLIRAQVRSVHTPDSPRELFQIGVELEIPSNVWGLSTPPEDWQKLIGGEFSTTHLATGGNLPREPGSDAPANGATNGPQAVPSPNNESTKQAAAKTERFVITSDQLILSVRPKLQQAAEQAMHSAISSQLDEAVKEAIGKIQELRRMDGTQTESGENLAQNFEPMMRSSEEAILNRLEARLTEVRSQWMGQQEEQHRKMQELSERIERMVSEPRQEMVEKNGAAATAGPQMQSAVFENKVQARMDDILKRVTQEFESAATRVSDRHLIRLMEDKQMVAREATAQMEARAAEARAMVHSAAGDAVDEFRRQLQSQVDMMIAEASQKAGSALASMEAESRSACETRRRSLETDVARVAEQSAEQFRTGIKAFLYSCLVAAVSAVDEHSQSTLEGLVKDGPKDAKENGHNGKVPHQFTIPGDGSNENNEN